MLAGASPAELDEAAGRPPKATGAGAAGSGRAPADAGGAEEAASAGRKRGANNERAVTGTAWAAAGAE